MAQAVRPGDTVVDATMGNGHDTLILARLVGDSGLVHAFDVQQQAVESTRKLLSENGLLHRVQLHLCGHEHMVEQVAAPLRLVCFNLGWLPGSDKRVRTLWPTTREALIGALRLLAPLGCATVCAYPGHKEGREELEALVAFLSQLAPQRYNVLHQRFLNAGPGAPECFVIQKQGQL